MGKLLTVVALAASLAYAHAPAESQIRKVLAVQVDAWNRGDIPAFVKTYAADCTFVGAEVVHGRDAVLARYRKRYSTAAAMGHLAFTALNVQQLDATTAIVYGNWHLDRGAAAGGPVGGVFSLVVRSIGGAWLIVLDHTC
ncbi:MAG: nuclear transport factor 2 family protein [Bryobacteraceae bacterium]